MAPAPAGRRRARRAGRGPAAAPPRRRTRRRTEPLPIRRNLLGLSNFVDRQTAELLAVRDEKKVEALVDMGARRAAIQASGVGESDLAVPTEDGVKEAKNRRAVIDILP